MAGLRATASTLAIAGEPIGQIADIAGPNMSASTIDVSAHDSTDQWREFLGGMRDAGEVPFDVNWDQANTDHKTAILQGVNAAGLGGATQTILITFAGTANHTFSCDGVITGWNLGLPLDDKQSASITIKFSGRPTFGAP